ncbi:MAG: SLBB domain-containing protein, partial [Proteobacteria bacterium]|nr:SLBB domain-containing protein [Pseudomonadota bacterium]
NMSLQLAVSRDGLINFPQLGPISVGGQRYGAVKRELEARIAKQMIGVRASVSMGDTRTINVFVLGEAINPGSYTVTGLATVTTALFAAGGVRPQGSLRRIEVRRQGVLVREFDLYDLLMHGDSSNDVNLQPGDVVMIPSVGPTAAVDGEVQRPAIYELKGPATVANLIEMAGGLTPEADPGSASLLHVNAERQRVVINVEPAAAAAQTQSVGNGDSLHVARLKPIVDSGVLLQGYVYRPGSFAWHEGLKLTDVIGNLDELKPNADQNYVLIRRVLMPDRRVTVLSADLAAALRAPDSPANVALQPRDTLTVFDLQTGRDRIIEPLMLELNLQGSLARPTEVVHVDGKVKVPGDYPLEGNMRVSDLIRAGGGLDPSAFGGHAELSRFTVENGEQRRTHIIAIDLAAVARGDEAANVQLQPFDELSVKEISGWTDQDQVTLKGEVRFPGIYAIKRGETLRSVIARAGGLTDLAFADGAVFLRPELQAREQDQLDRLAERLKTDLASAALMAAHAGAATASTEITVGQSLLAQIKATRAVGRLVIDLNAAIHAAPGSANDVALRSGDQLLVPRLRQEVMVLGEVQSPASQLYDPDLSREDYIKQSGGFTRQADRSHVYVVRANGSVVNGNRHWLVGFGGEPIRAGDTVVVPMNTDRLPSLPLWQAISEILYHIAISTVAVHSL